MASGGTSGESSVGVTECGGVSEACEKAWGNALNVTQRDVTDPNELKEVLSGLVGKGKGPLGSSLKHLFKQGGELSSAESLCSFADDVASLIGSGVAGTAGTASIAGASDDAALFVNLINSVTALVVIYNAVRAKKLPMSVFFFNVFDEDDRNAEPPTDSVWWITCGLCDLERFVAKLSEEIQDEFNWLRTMAEDPRSSRYHLRSRALEDVLWFYREFMQSTTISDEDKTTAQLPFHLAIRGLLRITFSMSATTTWSARFSVTHEDDRARKAEREADAELLRSRSRSAGQKRDREDPPSEKADEEFHRTGKRRA